MPFDFSKLSSPNSSDTVIAPREIFAVLPNKDPKYQYPRDVQGEVWGAWFQRRNEHDLVLRMNTGGGKTVVGLIILKSCLNEGKGPAVYVAPDQYLAKQVISEAASLGLDVTDNKDSTRFLSGKAILVTTVRTVVNGKSTFGVGQQGVLIPIGSLIIDDAHACLETTESQFTLTLNGKAHQDFSGLFKSDLEAQSEATAAEVATGSRGPVMQVPYWSWIAKQGSVIKFIQDIYRPPKKDEKDEYGESNRDAVRFNFPLIRDVLRLCRCVIGEGQVEISPRILPISVIPAFAAAARRIVMSATLADDSVLISHFDWDSDALAKPITPNAAHDIGDRMILLPQGLNPKEFTDDVLRQFFHGLSKTKNVVVIVPSSWRAQFWQDVASKVLKADNLEEGVKQLKAGHVGLVVLVNKYDGIDLPGSACEVLIIDGLPDVRRGIDKVEEAVLMGSDYILGQRIQRIEQGMGRGVRSSEDHCLVFLMGKTLTSFLYKLNAKAKFGTATRAQMALSEKVSGDLFDGPLQALEDVSMSFLKRDKHWVAASKGALVQLKYEASQSPYKVVQIQREAFSAASRNDANLAVRLMRDLANETTDPKTKGWLLQQQAEYAQFVNPTDSQIMLRAAVSINQRVLRPLEGIDYRRISSSTMKQAERCSLRLRENYTNGNQLLVEVNGILERLIFLPETSEAFEQAIRDVGHLIGFDTQRPEKEFGRGPDLLWEVGEMGYFVIECKNGVTSDRPINKHDCNQLNGSVAWFKEEYDNTCSCLGVLVHPCIDHDHAASLHEDTRIVTAAKLDQFKDAVRQFAVSVSGTNWADANNLGAILNACNLTKSTLPRFMVKPNRPVH